MKWIPVAVDLDEEPKMMALADRLGLPYAWAHVIHLWWWCTKHAPDGQLGRLPPAVLRTALDLPVSFQPQLDLKAALVELELLDPDGRVHAWDGWIGWFLARQKREAERKRDIRRTGAGHPQDGGRTSAGRGQDVLERSYRSYRSKIKTRARGPEATLETPRPAESGEPGPQSKGALSHLTQVLKTLAKAKSMEQPRRFETVSADLEARLVAVCLYHHLNRAAILRGVQSVAHLEEVVRYFEALPTTSST